jgi:hypothetical protein
VSESLDLSARRSLELLARLRETFASYAQREERHARDFAARRHAANRKHRDESSRIASTLEAQLSEVDGAAAKAEGRVKVYHDTRRNRIQRLQAKLNRTLPQRAKEAKGKWLSKLQVKELTAERDKEKGLEKADEEDTVFRARLERRKKEFDGLKYNAYRFFSGYRSFTRTLENELRAERAEPTGTPNKLHDELKASLNKSGEELTKFRQLLLPKLFAALPIVAVLLFVFAGAFAAALALKFTSFAWTIAGGVAGGGLILVVLLYLLGRAQGSAVADAFAAEMAVAHRLHGACAKAAEAHHQAERKKVEDNYQAEHKAISEKWAWASTVESEFERVEREKFAEQVPRMLAKNDELAQPKLRAIADTRAARARKLQDDATAQKQRVDETYQAELTAIAAAEQAQWGEIEASWRRDTASLADSIRAMEAALAVPAWAPGVVESWQPRPHFAQAARFAELELNADPQSAPKRLVAETAMPSSLPVALTFPGNGSLLFESKDSGHGTVVHTLNNLILRILAAMPPGKAAFTIIDPVGLGQSFAGLMHLADYEEALINRRIWTQRDQIEERLSELNEHVEKVIQMYLRNEYATISQYNEEAGSVAEKYHFLVIADFPANFSEVAVRRLQSILASGPRCGVFTFLHWDKRQALPDGLTPEDLRKHTVNVRSEHGTYALPGQDGASLVFDASPADEMAAAFVHRIGKSSVDSNRVEVPFAQIAPAPGDRWKSETTNELKVAIGRTGATKQQMLAIGKGTRQHALFAGKTGSGKSTLFHVIITNLALSCSPEQVEFYLIDFKKGVEFKCYAEHRLPHARVVAIESDREFGLSVLQRVDEELKRRGDIFRKLGVQDVPGYKRAAAELKPDGSWEPMPRVLLMIDEFQEFFTEDDHIAQTASLLFDRIVRQGRAFGIHVLLGSQTLGGAYTLARATLGQMVIRVALQCNEADAHLIMDENNSAPRLLSRPGEGIYNDAAGVLEGNSPFQVVWLSDAERDDLLAEVRKLAEDRGDKHSGPIVFEGNAPAEIRENHLLAAALDTPPAAAPAAPRCWLGAPNSIKGPTEAVFYRQGGNHVLVVGQRDEAMTTMFGVSMLSLAAQFPPGSAKFVLFLSANPGSPDAEALERITAALPHEVTVARPHDAGEAMAKLGTELKERSSGDSSSAPPIFIFIHGLHRFKKLKHEDDFDFSSGSDSEPNAGAILNSIINDGSSQGLHLIISMDTYSNVGRYLSRKALGEFEMRVVFQMSANDSASLIDAPKASTLGLHRALLYNEREGTLETFRPYAALDNGWLEEAAEKLKARK